MQKYFSKKWCLATCICLIFLLMGCGASFVPNVNDVTMTPKRLARKVTQSRFFDIDQPDRLIRAAMNVIQDQHYTIRETNVEAGMVFADQTNELDAPFRLFSFPMTGYNPGNMPGF